MNPNEKIMLSIPECSKKTGIAKLNLRNLCKEGKITYIKSGTKYLINYGKLLEQLNNGEIREV